jgi:hypothetical protein
VKPRTCRDRESAIASPRSRWRNQRTRACARAHTRARVASRASVNYGCQRRRYRIAVEGICMLVAITDVLTFPQWITFSRWAEIESTIRAPIRSERKPRDARDDLRGRDARKSHGSSSCASSARNRRWPETVPRTVRGRRAKPRWCTPTRRTPTPVPTPARTSAYVGVRAACLRYRAHGIYRARDAAGEREGLSEVAITLFVWIVCKISRAPLAGGVEFALNASFVSFVGGGSFDPQSRSSYSGVSSRFARESLPRRGFSFPRAAVTFARFPTRLLIRKRTVFIFMATIRKWRE